MSFVMPAKSDPGAGLVLVIACGTTGRTIDKIGLLRPGFRVKLSIANSESHAASGTLSFVVNVHMWSPAAKPFAHREAVTVPPPAGNTRDEPPRQSDPADQNAAGCAAAPELNDNVSAMAINGAASSEANRLNMDCLFTIVSFCKGFNKIDAGTSRRLPELPKKRFIKNSSLE
ncbi:MAG: hypothetical protein FWC38_07005 [Proteobacteria bacterium]|nr:hypothetical protein [Pseudomonadota bacterium]